MAFFNWPKLSLNDTHMQKLLSENDYFRTSDLALCATLSCCGFHLEAIDKQNPNKAIFLIERESGLDDCVAEYWQHNIKVDPLLFFGFLKEIKTRIHENNY